MTLYRTVKNVTRTILSVQPPQWCREGKRRFEAAVSVPLVRNSPLVSQQLAKTIDTYDEPLYIDHQRELAKGYQNNRGERVRAGRRLCAGLHGGPGAGGVSLVAQEANIDASATVKDRTLLEIIRDEGVSAKSPKRPGLERLLALVDAGEVDVVIIYKLDRLTRSVLTSISS
jgi:hypothetical protein